MRRRPGFSLVEALVVLAISGMALTVMFSIGSRAGEAGFSLGRRALAAAEEDLALADLRTLLDSPLLPPLALIVRDDPRVIRGDAVSVRFEGLPSRPTPCTPRGWRGQISLRIDQSAGEPVIVCQSGDRAPVAIARLGARVPVFEYSLDGLIWQATIDTTLPEGALPAASPLAPRAIFIRLRTDEDTLVLSMPGSGLPESWLTPDDLV